MFETKIAIVVREDLAVWQKLNVTAFLMSGIVGANPGIIGEPYKDVTDSQHLGLSIQPVIVLAADAPTLVQIRRRALERKIPTAIYIEEMFATGHDAANRAVFAAHGPDEPNVVGVALRAEKKVTDKITKGARMHS
jgi:hypothetical protein